MLVAINEHGEHVTLTESLTEAALQRLRKTKVYCPHCKKALILKAGAIKIPHFAHTADTACVSLFAEGESFTHLLGKQQLYNHLQQLGEEVQLECYLPHLQQRPDLLVTRKRLYALEFQCSRIPLPMMAERTKGYQTANIMPVWLLKTPSSFLKKGTVLKFSLTQFHQQFIQDNYLITYAPETEQFHYFCHFFFLQGNTFLARLISLSLKEQVFPFYEPKKMRKEGFNEMFSEYTRYRLRFLKNRLFYSQKGVSDLFLRAVYELRLPREKLPLFIGIPVTQASGIPVFSAEWQLLFFYFLYCHGLSATQVREDTMKYFLSWAGFPVTEQACRAVTEYIRILEKLSIRKVESSYSMEQLIELVFDQIIAID
ncbi:competence protein CoiA [Lysinibacillus odysseyi]|uniref:competence protein CoiA n=1 Tax=Lysinibacillus odysseyi TaxID=202611 RepID=UPI000690219C|nr:competence protein CoiA family protein [Lysinibacillus odysseyi]